MPFYWFQLHQAWRALILLVVFAGTTHADPEDYVTPLKAKVELDLVFPTPNETYKRIFPFPIVFAFQGMKQAWPHRVAMDWEVRAEGEEQDDLWRSGGSFPLGLPREERGDTGSVVGTEGQSPGDLDTVFYTVGARNVRNSTATTFTILYWLYYYENCSIAEEWSPRLFEGGVAEYKVTGSLSFMIDDETGLDPTAVGLPDDTCAMGLATIQMKAFVGADISSAVRASCPILDDEDLSPEPSPCGVTPPANLQSSNPSLDSSCELQLEHSYCVKAPTKAATSPDPTPSNPTSSPIPVEEPTTPVQPGTGIETPQPIQPGMVENCDAFYLVQPGDSCYIVASENGITVPELHSWNLLLGTDCEGMWADYYICVSVIGHEDKPPTGIETPTPIQPGMVSNCDEFHYVVEGDVCYSIALEYNITTAQFLEFNPKVGGAGCTGLWANVYVCVGVVD
ncbi:uncharacterized protein DNG_10138 [Cephalotrichum gorgonifer]|uniref:LysM domain-containing protein n=1 Tax=Cephalotrichum gorgonifer TaxID=2041049 RepID=A0AAE8N8B1_9PEZI|nr:uncharacterized protein DNG_10138 [Cephalotrichum gorgonifer]